MSDCFTKSKIFTLTLCLFLYSATSCAARELSSTKRFAPQIELTAKKGITGKKAFKRDIGRLGIVYPLYQTSKSVAFFTLIGMGDTNKALEGNFGGGYRIIKNRSAIIGGYLFYDLRSTPNKNKVHQVTMGGEFMYSALETRANIYLPITKEKAVRDYDKYHAKYNGRTTSIKSYRHNVSEVLLSGFDIEAGGFLPMHSKLSGFLAFYHFGRSGTDAKSINGVRFRTNYSFIDWFALEGECSNDATAGFVSYLGVKFNWSPALNRKGINAESKLINRRMTQLPVRDVDAVTANVEDVNFKYHHNAKGKVDIYSLDPNAEFELENVKVVRTIKEANSLKKSGTNNIKFIDSNGNVSYLATNSDTHKVELVKGKVDPIESGSKTLKTFKIENLDHSILKKHYDRASGKNVSKALKKVIGIKLEQNTISVDTALRDKLLSNPEIIRNAIRRLQLRESSKKDVIAIIKKAQLAGVPNKEIAAGVIGVFTPHSIEDVKEMMGGRRKRSRQGGDQETPPMINPGILQKISEILDAQGVNRTDILDGAVAASENMYHALKDSIPVSSRERKEMQMKYKAKTHHYEIASMVLQYPSSNNHFTIDNLYGSSLQNSMVAGAVVGAGLRNYETLSSIVTREKARVGLGITDVDIARGIIEHRENAEYCYGCDDRAIVTAGIGNQDVATAYFQSGLDRGISLRAITSIAMHEMSQPNTLLNKNLFVIAAQRSGISKARLQAATPSSFNVTINAVYP